MIIIIFATIHHSDFFRSLSATGKHPTCCPSHQYFLSDAFLLFFFSLLSLFYFF
jgi:hypothetical protein